MTTTTTAAPPTTTHLVERYLPGSFAQRLGAIAVDALLFLALVATPATLASWWFGPGDFTYCEIVGSSESCSITAEALAYTRTVFYALSAVWVLAYSWTIHRGSSIGKRSTEIMVVDAATGATIGFGRAVARTLLSVLGLAAFGLGLLFALTNPERRALHDKLLGTRVISY